MAMASRRRVHLANFVWSAIHSLAAIVGNRLSGGSLVGKKALLLSDWPWRVHTFAATLALSKLNAYLLFGTLPLNKKQSKRSESENYDNLDRVFLPLFGLIHGLHLYNLLENLKESKLRMFIIAVEAKLLIDTLIETKKVVYPKRSDQAV